MVVHYGEYVALADNLALNADIDPYHAASFEFAGKEARKVQDQARA
jgi:hypothetical protein